jgi:hypothetical protein
MIFNDIILNNLNNVIKTLEKNQKYDVDISKSSIWNFELDKLINDLIIYKNTNENTTLKDLEIMQDLLNTDSYNDEFLIDNDIKFFDDIREYAQHKEDLIKEYVKDQSYYSKEYVKIQDQNRYNLYNEIEGTNWYFVYNFINHELDIQDEDNINRLGNSIELRYWSI